MNANLKVFESKERNLCEKLFSIIPEIEAYRFTEGKICYDVVIMTKSKKVILGEVKVRSFEIHKYDTYILEVSKLISLINKQKKLGSDRIYYINFFSNKSEGVMDFIIFNLTERIKTWKKVKPITIKKYMNAVTYISKEDKVEKEVIMLVYDDKIDCQGVITVN
jgi:hypothetical protein